MTFKKIELASSLFLKFYIKPLVFDKIGSGFKDRFLRFMYESNHKTIISLGENSLGLYLETDKGPKIIPFNIEHDTFVFSDVIEPVEGDSASGTISFKRTVRGNHFSDFIRELSHHEIITVDEDSSFKRFMDFSEDYMNEEMDKLESITETSFLIREASFESKQQFILRFAVPFNEKACERMHFKLVSQSGLDVDGGLVLVSKLRPGLYSISPVNDTHFPENLTNIAGYSLQPDVQRQKGELLRKIRAYKRLCDEPQRYEDIWSIIQNPEELSQLTDMPKVDFYQQGLSPSIQHSIRSILKEELIHVVQGPPGTGKTTLITELCAQLIGQGKNIIVAAQNNLAIDNVIENLRKMKVPEVANARIVRLGREESLRLDSSSDLLTRERSKAMVMDTQKSVSSILKTLERFEGRALPDNFKVDMKKLNEIKSLLILYNSRIDELNSLLYREKEFQEKMGQIEMGRSDIILTGFMFQKNVPFRVYSCLRIIYQDPELRNEFENAAPASLNSILNNTKKLPSDDFDIELDEHEKSLLTAIENQFDFKDICNYVDRFDDNDFKELIENLERLKHVESRLIDHQKDLDSLIQQRSGILEQKNSIEEVTNVFSELESPEHGAILQLEKFKDIYTPYVKALMELSHDVSLNVAKLDSYVIGSANVVFSTCSQLAGGPMTNANRLFDVAIVDEASKAQVGELLIPMMISKRHVLVGDHKQLPPVIKADQTEKKVLVKSFFERLYERLPKNFKTQLKFQYRMPPQISHAISMYYDTELQNALHLDYSKYEDGQAFHWIRVEGDVEDEVNKKELDETMHLLEKLINKYPNEEIGVISAYRRHHDELHKRFANLRQDNHLRMCLDKKIIELGTIDEFQGRQKDIVIINTVRNGRDLRHMGEKQRINVAFSRCKKLLYLVGHPTLDENENFQKILNRLLNSSVKDKNVA